MDLEEIRRGLTKPGKTKGGLAKALGRQPSAVTALLNGEREIKAKEIPVIRAYFDAEAAHIESSAILSDRRPENGILELDVRAGLGGGGTTDGRQVVHHGDVADPVKSEAWHFPDRFMREELRAPEERVVILETQGDSMSPTILSGDRVIVDTRHVTPSPDGIYALRDGYGTIVVKRLQLLRGGNPTMVKIISDNPHHTPQEVPAEEIEGSIIGRVLWGLKRL